MSVTLRKGLVLGVAVLFTASNGFAAGRNDAGKTDAQKVENAAKKAGAAAAAQGRVDTNKQLQEGRRTDPAVRQTPKDVLRSGGAATKEAPGASRAGGDHSVKGGGGGGVKLKSDAKGKAREVLDGTSDAFKARVAERLKGGDPTKEGVERLRKEVRDNGEKIDKMDLQKNYEALKGSFNLDTMPDHKATLAKIRASLKGSKLSDAEKQNLETAILVFLAEMDKLPANQRPEALKQLNALLEDFKDELADADPKMRDMAMDYILGSLAYYGKTADGKPQLDVAKALWNDTSGTAREGLADMMEARAKLHSENIAQQVAAGKGPKTIDYEKAWKAVDDGIVDWVVTRLAMNGEDLSKLPDTLRDILCKCSKHGGACKI